VRLRRREQGYARAAPIASAAR